MLFPIVGAWSDVRRGGRLHPAGRWGIGTILGSVILTQAITYTPIGKVIYDAVTDGYSGAAVDPLGFRPMPDSGHVSGAGRHP